MLIEKRHLEPLWRVLGGTDEQLTLAEARVRDRAYTAVTEELKAFEQERKAIYEKFCTKLEDGTPDTSDNQYRFVGDDKTNMETELNVLLDEKVEITLPDNIAAIAEKTTYKPRVGESEAIDAMLTAIRA